MKKIFILTFLLTISLCNAQWIPRFGITAGINSYNTKADFLSTKSGGIGYTLGVVGSNPVSENSEILVDFTYNRFSVEMLGRENLLAEPEWIKFHNERINMSVIYDYDLIFLLDEDLVIGACAGPTLSIFNNYTLDDDTKERYYMDPYGISAKTLEIDSYNTTLTLNAYATFGISVRYRNLESSLRYNLGFTDPYRNFTSNYEHISTDGNDSFIGFQLTYYFGEYF